MNEHRECPYNYLVGTGQCKQLTVQQYAFEDRLISLGIERDKYYDAYHELKDAVIALVQRLELDKDVKKNNWWLNERAKIMKVIDDNEGYDED